MRNHNWHCTTRSVLGASDAPACATTVARQLSRWLLSAALCCLIAVTVIHAEMDGQGIVTVSVKKTANGFELRRGNEPYRVLGVGGRSKLAELAAAGGNSIRTWHPHGLDDLLDRAHGLGLTATVGLWLKHERHGFDYSDTAAVAKQHAAALGVVRQYKDHPAVLMWGIGNEMEGDGDNEQIWRAINHLARDIKTVDPHHPTMTVIAGVSNDKVRKFSEHCPHIDVLGVNTYGDLCRIPEQLQRQGLDRPYVITEFGPYGWWQVEKTSWGAELEPSSTAKAETYMRSWRAAVRDQPNRCFGSYAFLWGHKQEHTQTWFGMFLPTGERTSAVDVMSKAWTGRWPPNRCPALTRVIVQLADESGKLNNRTEHVYAPGSLLSCRAVGHDPDGDSFKIRWELRPESTDKKTGGDLEKVPLTIESVIVGEEGTSARVQLPRIPGPYRLFVFLIDGHGGAATANVPLLIKN